LFFFFPHVTAFPPRPSTGRVIPFFFLRLSSPSSLSFFFLRSCKVYKSRHPLPFSFLGAFLVPLFTDFHPKVIPLTPRWAPPPPESILHSWPIADFHQSSVRNPKVLRTWGLPRLTNAFFPWALPLGKDRFSDYQPAPCFPLFSTRFPLSRTRISLSQFFYLARLPSQLDKRDLFF